MSKLSPPVLSEFWLPIETIGAECMRERGASSALPPLYFLHVWWARRPLTVSRAAILAGVLPQWHKAWPKELLKKFPSEADYQQWFLKLIGIHGDPVAGRKLLQYAAASEKKIPNPYTYSRAFTYNPTEEQLEILGDLLEYAWGTRELSVLDPFSGGGSIPFEALRYGFKTYANELNPVASVILKATLDYPARFGIEFAGEIRKWGKVWTERIQKRLKLFFTPIPLNSEGSCYLWARTVACPTTGKPVPLSPNWWLIKGSSEPVCVKLIAKADEPACRFEIVKGKAAVEKAKPDEGTVARGVGKSPWTGEAVDGDYIKAEAQAGRMGEQLYAVGIKTSKGFEFRPPTQADLDACEAAKAELLRRLPDWEANGLMPNEPRRENRADWSCEIYGMTKWSNTFAPRQLLSLVTAVEELRTLEKEIRASMPKEKADAVVTYLSIVQDKACDYDSTGTTWHSSRQVMSHTFQRHDFSFKWSYGEFDAAGNLFPWVLDQVADAYKGIAELAKDVASLFNQRKDSIRVIISKSSASELADFATGSLTSICTDPPYYDNVMYANCADFFYVWQKRTVGHIFPGWFESELTDKDNEAVVNVARFEGAKKKVDLAKADYERKMAAAFREMHRVLHPNGVLTVMFTHKQVAAWDTLATSLIGAGFSIHASWPVMTESDKSLHQAKKNAAASTILLVCRKRGANKTPTWWDDIKGQVRQTAREKAEQFHTAGISGVDLYISTFGPALAILSQKWPVLSSEIDADGNPRPLKPEVALDLAREEVVKLRKEKLLHGRAVQFDPVTDWYLIAWDAFKAERFPGDEARKLAIVLGLDLEGDIIRTKKLATKKGADVILNQPKARRKKGMVDPDLDVFDTILDAVHTAMMVYDEDGARACEVFLKRTGLISDSTFKMVVQALLNTIPRTKIKGRFVRPEAQTLDDLRLKFFDDLEAPPEEVPPKVPTQEDLFTGLIAEDDGEPEEESDEEDEE
jgi:adenine-specific DNA methylase